MKTLLSLLMVLVLTTAASALDSYRLDASGLFLALAVATLFAFALNDRPLRDRLPPDARPAKAGSIRAEAWAGQKMCVLCEGASY
jgi:hypothetical protein